MNQKQKINKVKTGLNLYRLIEASGKTRIEIAEYLELESTRVIYDWTSGIKLPSLENLLIFAYKRQKKTSMKEMRMKCLKTEKKIRHCAT